jgi:hypothetical protein
LFSNTDLQARLDSFQDHQTAWYAGYSTSSDMVYWEF